MSCSTLSFKSNTAIVGVSNHDEYDCEAKFSNETKTANVYSDRVVDGSEVRIQNPRRNRGVAEGDLSAAQVAGIQRAMWLSNEKRKNTVRRERERMERKISDRRQQARVFSSIVEDTTDITFEEDVIRVAKMIDHKLVVAANMRNKAAKKARKHARRASVETESSHETVSAARKAWEEAMEEHEEASSGVMDGIVSKMKKFMESGSMDYAKSQLGKYSWFINDLCTVLATLILARKANDFASQVALATLFVNGLSSELCFRDKLVAATLVTLAQRVLHSFKRVEHTVETEGFVDTLEDFANNLRSVKDGAFVTSVRNLLVTTAALRMFDRGIALQIFKHLGKPSGVDTVDLVSQALLGIAQMTKYFNLIKDKTIGISELLFGGDPTENAIREGRRLNALKSSIYVGTPIDGGIHQVEFMSRARKALPILRSVMAKMNPMTSMWKSCAAVEADLGPTVLDIENKLKGSQRMAPWAICITSDPGVGKSTWISWICRVASDAAGRKFSEDHVYHRTKGSEYWEIYNGWNHPFVHFSEAGDDLKSIVEKVGDPMMTELTGLIDNAPKTVNSAFGDKNKNYFFSEGIVMDSNNGDKGLNFKYYKNNPAAYLRRILFVAPRVMEDFRKAVGCGIDPSKGDPSVRLMDKFVTDIYIEQQLNNRDTQREYLAQGAKIDDVYNILFDYFVAHMATQARIVGLKDSDVDVKYGTRERTVKEVMFDGTPLKEEEPENTGTVNWVFPEDSDNAREESVSHLAGHMYKSVKPDPSVGLYDEKGDPYVITQAAEEVKVDNIVVVTKVGEKIETDESEQEQDDPREKIRRKLMKVLTYERVCQQQPAFVDGISARKISMFVQLQAVANYATHSLYGAFNLVIFYTLWFLLWFVPATAVDETFSWIIDWAVFFVGCYLLMFGFLFGSFPGFCIGCLLTLIIRSNVVPVIKGHVSVESMRKNVSEHIASNKSYLLGTLWSDTVLVYAGVGVGALISTAAALKFAACVWDGFRNSPASIEREARSKNPEYEQLTNEQKAMILRDVRAGRYNKVRSQGNTQFIVPADADDVINAIEERVGAERAHQRRKGKIPDAWVVKTVKEPIVHTGDAKTLESAVLRNSRITRVIVGDVDRGTQILGVKGNMALINKHSLPKGGKYVLKVNMSGVRSNVDNYRETTGYAEQAIPVGGDIVMIPVSQMQFTDITKHFTDHSFKNTTGVIGGDAVAIKHMHLSEMTANDAIHGPIRVDNPLEYNWDGHHKGACGSVIVASFGSTAAIVGLHYAGDTTRARAFGSRVTKSMVDAAYLKSLSSTVMMPVVSQSNEFVSYGKTHDRSPFNFENLHNVEYLGSDERTVIMENRSRLHVSEIASSVDHILEPMGKPRTKTFCPPLLKPVRKGVSKEFVNPFTVNLKKLNTVKKSLDPVIMERVVRKFVDHIVTELRDTKITPLILEEAINGAKDDEYIRRINVKTGSGYPFLGKKFKHLPISLEDDGVLIREPTAELRKILHKRLEEFVEEKVSSVSIFGAKLKDEPRVVEKVIAGKTRMFFPSPIDLLIVSRMALAPFFTLMVEHNDTFRCAVGIDMFSQGENFYNALKEFADGDEVCGFEGDYGGFDTSMPFEIGHAASSVVYRVCEQLGYNQSALNLLSGVLSDNLYPYVEVNGDIMGVPGLMTSGSYGTAEFNCIRNVILMLYFFESHPQLTMDDFFDKTFIRTYGDDVVGVVQTGIKPFFNCCVYSRFCK